MCLRVIYAHTWLEASMILWFRSRRCTEALVCLFQREFQISLLWTADQSELISAPSDGGPATPGHEAAALLPETEVDTRALFHILLSVSLVPVFLSLVLSPWRLKPVQKVEGITNGMSSGSGPQQQQQQSSGLSDISTQVQQYQQFLGESWHHCELLMSEA